MSLIDTEDQAVAAGSGAGVCPSCRAGGLRVFHHQDGIPVHSVRLVETYEEARAFPRGDLRLAVCGACGFITNTAYDATLQDYGVAYEETQGFSPTFRQFSRDLARRWIERYDLRGKHVLEIGSGKGEFLVDLCEQGVAGATGIDPSYVEGRLTSPAAERITFIKDYYAERYADLPSDAIVCRHTLEHIHETGDLLALVRRSIERRPETPVLFELPDVLRVLNEVAFWDVYYEHCSYFTPGSLARLYRLSGFDVVELERDYDDQYNQIGGRLTQGEPAGPHPLEESTADVLAAVEHFRTAFAETKRRWTEKVSQAVEAGGRVVIWGAGSKGVSFLTTLGIERQIEYAVDVNPHKQGKYMAATGQRVVGPDFLREYRPDLVIAMNPIYLAEIGAQLASMDLDPELTAV